MMRSRGIPTVINATLAIIYAGANVFQFFVLPLWLLPKNIHWAWTVVPLALLTNPFWSLIHESIHDLFHPNRVTWEHAHVPWEEISQDRSALLH